MSGTRPWVFARSVPPCTPLDCLLIVYVSMTWTAICGGRPWVVAGVAGRGFHSFPFPLNLSLLCLSAQLKLTFSPIQPKLTRGRGPKMLNLSSDGSDVFPKVLKLSFEGSECKPLVAGLFLPHALGHHLAGGGTRGYAMSKHQG